MQEVNHSVRFPSRYVEVCAQLLLALSALAFLYSGITSNYLGSWTETRADFWRIYAVCLSHSPLESALLKSNNHSIFFPSLIWLTDIRFFHNNQELLFYFGLFFQIATASLMLVPVWRERSVSLTSKLAATLAVVVGNFWMGRATITTSGGFNCMCSMALGGAVLAFVRLPGLREGAHYWRALLVIVAGAYLASFSFGSGLAVWPALLLVAWSMRLSRRSLILLMLTGVSATLIYIYLPGAANPTLALDGLVRKLSKGIFRLCMLTGTPAWYARAAWSSTPMTAAAAQSSLLSLVTGAAGLLLALLAIGPRLIKQDLLRSNMEMMGIALVLFNLGAVTLIIIGRVEDFRVNPSEVAAARYMFWSAIFWAGLLMIAIQRTDSKPWMRWPLLLLILALPVAVLPEHRRETANAFYGSTLAREAATSLINGVDDPQVIRFLSGIPSQVYTLVPKFRAQRLDMFAAGLQNWIGRNANSFNKRAPRATALRGNLSVDALVRDQRGNPAARFQGWMVEGNNYSPRQLIVTNPSGVVCGVARPIQDQPIIKQANMAPLKGSLFVGYIRDYQKSTAYVARSVYRGQLSEEKIVVQPLN